MIGEGHGPVAHPLDPPLIVSLHYLVKLSICILQVNYNWKSEPKKTHQNVFIVSFTKTDGEVCVHDFDHLGASYN